MHDPNVTAYLPYSFPPSEHTHERVLAADEMMNMHALPEVAQILSRLILIFGLLMSLFLITVPWQQTSEGTGRLIAYLPEERVQNIHAPVSGRIKEWFVREGTKVKAGDPIVEIVDIDPEFIRRLQTERDQLEKQLRLAESVSATRRIDFERQKILFEQGIGARRERELAEVAVREAESTEMQARASLLHAESRFARQQSQMVLAPYGGTVVRLRIGTNSQIITESDVLAVFVPESDQFSAEIYIDGNDLPLVFEGRKARLQFEGWPAMQFSGWPSIAKGTFGGRVVFVDQTANDEGKFRVILVQDGEDEWPKQRFIRQGTRVKGWILMERVSMGYELWRRFNGFPPSMSHSPELKKSNDLFESSQSPKS